MQTLPEQERGILVWYSLGKFPTPDWNFGSAANLVLQ